MAVSTGLPSSGFMIDEPWCLLIRIVRKTVWEISQPVMRRDDWLRVEALPRLPAQTALQ